MTSLRNNISSSRSNSSNSNSNSNSHSNSSRSNSNSNMNNNDMLIILSTTLEDFYEQNTPETIITTSKILTTILKNALKVTSKKITSCCDDDNKKMELYRRIRLSNPKIQNHIVNVSGALDILGLAGFETASSITNSITTTVDDPKKNKNKNNNNGNNNNEFLVYMPNNKPSNALEFYLQDDDNDDNHDNNDDNHDKNGNQTQQEQLVNAIIHGLDVKVQELQVMFGITDDKTKKIAATSATSKSTNNNNNNDDSSSSSPFLSEEERLKRLAKIKAMKKAKKAAKSAALNHWEENKQERKEAEARREALLQAKIQAEAKATVAAAANEEGGGNAVISPLGVTIKSIPTATNSSSPRRTQLPLAKPMAPAVDLDQQKQALAAAAKARMERSSTTTPASLLSSSSNANANAAAAAERANPMTSTAAANKDISMDIDEDGEIMVPDCDKKLPAKKRPAQNSNANSNNIENDSSSSSSSPAMKKWEFFLEHVPRCAPAEGIRDSSYYRGKYNDETTTVSPKCLKKLFKELDNLKDMLPSNHNSSIWLRFDEEAPQYIRALIAAVLPGPTPYSGGLFCFDIYIPSDYPQISPKVHLVSRGGVNFAFGPNLYPNGHVCLSLLGTTLGPGWIPGHSSLHQVLVSMQGLLLGIEHPYYLMRGGWDGLIKEGDFTSKGQTLTGKTVAEQVNIDNNAVLYEDKIRIGTVKYTMLEPLACCLDVTNNNKKKKKPKGTTGSTNIIWQQFKPIIRAHFSTNRIAILNEIRSWMSDQVMGRNRSVIRNEKIAIDELNDLLPKLENHLSKISMPETEDSVMEIVSPVLPAASLKNGSDDDDNDMPTEKPAAKKSIPAKQANSNDDEEEAAMDIEIDDDDTDTNQDSATNLNFIQKKRLRMQEAAAKGDFVRAGRLQEEVKRLEQLEKSIQEAARQNDYIRAGRLQAQLKALTTAESSRAGPLRPDNNINNNNNNTDMADDEGMSDDEEEEEEQGNLAEAMANMPGMGNPFGNPGMPGQGNVAGRRALPHGLGRNVFAPPAMRARIPVPNHSWGTGNQLNAPPAPAASPSTETPTSTKKGIPPDQLCRLRIRLPSDKSILEDFEKTQALSAVYRRLTALMPEEDAESQQSSATVAPVINGAGAFSQPLSSAGFTLLLTRPKREFSLEMHGTKSLDELNLAPSATLTVMKCSDRGVLHRGELESRLRQAQGDALDVDGLTYEGLVELTERVGAAAPAKGSTFFNISHEDLANNSKTFSPATYLDELDNSMEEHGEDERRCPICLGEYDPSEQSASLRKLSNCAHIFHSACLDTWLRTKSSCPLCKSSIVAGS